MQRIFGIVLLLGGTATTTGLGMLASRLAPDEQATPTHALLVHGTMIGTPVLITDVEFATALHAEASRPRKTAQLYPKELLMRRPCLTIAAFLSRSRPARAPSSEPWLPQADVSWFFYPALDDEPAVIGRAPVSRAHLDALSSYGLPVDVQRGASAPCAPRSAAWPPDDTRGSR